jgi:hypothetical protein
MTHRVVPAAPARKRSDIFSNGRDWRAFLALAAVQAPAAYSSVATALRAGHAWFAGHAGRAEEGTEACNRLLDEAGLGTHKTLGV